MSEPERTLEHRWWVGDRRWSIAGVIAFVGAAISASGGQWLEAGLFFGAAAVLAAVAVKTARRS